MGKTVLYIKNLSASYLVQGKQIPVLKDISLSIEKGESVAIIGESGAGKTTITDIILGTFPYKNGVIESGAITYGGVNLIREKEQIVGRKITYIPQDPSSALDPLFPVWTLFKEIMRGLRPHIPEGSLMQETKKVLAEVQLEGADFNVKSFPHQLSGGMQQRVLIALALLGSPELILADEPTSNLDVLTAHEIVEVLKEIKRTRNVSLMLTTHNLFLARELCETIFVMKDGMIVEGNETKAIFNAPQHQYTQQLIASLW